MKRLFTLGALLIGLGVTTFAQEGKHERSKRGDRKQVDKREMSHKSPEEIAKFRTERLDKTLKFTDKQRKEVYALHLDQAKKFKDRSEARKKEQAKRVKEANTNRDKLNSLLTAEQKKMLADNSKKFHSNREGRFRGKDGERPTRRHLDKKMDKKEGFNS